MNREYVVIPYNAEMYSFSDVTGPESVLEALGFEVDGDNGEEMEEEELVMTENDREIVESMMEKQLPDRLLQKVIL